MEPPFTPSTNGDAEIYCHHQRNGNTFLVKIEAAKIQYVQSSPIFPNQSLWTTDPKFSIFQL